MILTMDAGNTQIYGGVFDGDNLSFQFRKSARHQFSSDEIGLFLKGVLRENNIEPEKIEAISFCSVVPDKIHSMRNGCLKYFGLEPFILKPGVKTGLKIKYRNPVEVGSDRIANAIAAIKLFPDKNIIIVDFGTATTFCVISKEREYLGGIIIPGIRISMETLENQTAQLPRVEIKAIDQVVGRSTVESIQSGLYFGQIGIVNEITNRVTVEAFQGEKPVIIATGGFSSLFDNAGIFEVTRKTLVLEGLSEAYKLNNGNE